LEFHCTFAGANLKLYKNEESGVKIGYDIVVYQNVYTNWKFRNYIKQSLNQNEKGLISIMEIPTDGAHGYAMGEVITQIAYKMGEEKFLVMIKKLNPTQINELEGYLEVGLMYGYEDKELQTEFPALYQYFRDADE